MKLENKVFNRIFETDRDEEAGHCRKLKTEKFHNLYPSLTVIRVISTSRMRWVGHVALIGEMRSAHPPFVQKERKEITR
jgi:hypothetical protein